jgi:hypothetical protein
VTNKDTKEVLGVFSSYAGGKTCVAEGSIAFWGRAAAVNNPNGDNFIGDYIKNAKCAPQEEKKDGGGEEEDGGGFDACTGRPPGPDEVSPRSR